MKQKFLLVSLFFSLGILITCLFADKSDNPSLQQYQNDKQNWKEDDYNDDYAKKVNGTRETRKYYSLNGKKYYVVVDIETDKEVIEGGKDSRSSLDSIQQALFFSHLTDKKPVVVIYDTDGEVGIYEYRIQKACEKAGVEYRRVE